MSISELEQKIKDLSDDVQTLIKAHFHLVNAVQALSDDHFRLCEELKNKK